MKDIVKITADIISLDEIAKAVADPKAGAISTFSGTTRDNFEGMHAMHHVQVFISLRIPHFLVDRAGAGGMDGCFLGF